MTAEAALQFLLEHQPMPADRELTDQDGKVFAAVLSYFENHPDPRCLPLLIRSVSRDTGLGMYEHIKFVLMAQNREEVIRHLRACLQDGDEGVKYRCCWWASDVDAWELEDLIRPLTAHADEETQEAAESFLELRAELGQRRE